MLVNLYAETGGKHVQYLCNTSRYGLGTVASLGGKLPANEEHSCGLLRGQEISSVKRPACRGLCFRAASDYLSVN